MKKKITLVISLVVAIAIAVAIILILGNREYTPTLYQVCPDDSTLMSCHVIKTQSGKLIVVDGGGSDKLGYLYEELQRISGKKKPVVAAWFLTHLHPDHVMEFIMVGKNDNKIKIENVYFNFSSKDFYEKVEGGAHAYLLDDIGLTYDKFFGKGAFEKCNGKNVFEGDNFTIDGVNIEILMACLDEETESNINDTSLIFRATVEGEKIMFLGDAAVRMGNRLLEKYGADLKSDIVQMAHHGQGGVSEEVYIAIDPTICMWPSPRWVFNNTNGNLQTFDTRYWMTKLGVEYHMITGIHGTQALPLPVDYSKLEPEFIL